MTDDPDLTAAELALGVLDGPERAAALRRILAEPGFAAEVEAWRLHFAQLFDLWPEVDAPDDIIGRIDTSLGGPTAAARWRFPWPILAIASSAIAACLLLFVTLRPDPPLPAPVSQPVPTARTALLVASLDAKYGAVAAVFDSAEGSLRIATPPSVAATRVAQLWVIGGDGVPHALGLLGTKPMHLTPAAVDRARLAAGAVLAISVEPLGGSPTGLPTGPVIAKGALSLV